MNLDELLKIDSQHIWHPCSQMQDYEEYPVTHIERAEGVWLYKRDGTRIMDAVSSWWISIFGHCNAYIKNRIKEQLDKLEHVIFANYTHTPVIELTQHLVKLFKGRLPKVFFTDNGSSAVEAALKMSYHYWYNKGQPGKTKFVYLKGAYHGETLGALSVGSLDMFKKIYAPLLMQNVIEVPGPDCYRCPYQLTRESCQAECFPAMQQTLEKEHAAIAAVIVEPIIQCVAGMNIYSPVYLEKLRNLCTNTQVHLICDEIASGFGRTGAMMASDLANIVPDLAILSKTITGGFLPMAVIMASNEIYNAFYAPYEARKAFMHSHTYAGNPLACAAACAVFELFNEPEIFSRINVTGTIIREQLLPLLDLPNVGDIRSIGIINAIELVQDKKTKIPLDWKKRTGYQIYRQAEQQGLLLRNLGDVLYFMPPYTINTHEIEYMIKRAHTAIKSVLCDKC